MGVAGAGGYPSSDIRLPPTRVLMPSARRSCTGVCMDGARDRRGDTNMACTKSSSAFTSSTSWEAFVDDFRGPSYLSKNLDDIDHEAAPLLQKWRDEGVPADAVAPDSPIPTGDSEAPADVS